MNVNFLLFLFYYYSFCPHPGRQARQAVVGVSHFMDNGKKLERLSCSMHAGKQTAEAGVSQILYTCSHAWLPLAPKSPAGHTDTGQCS